MLKVKTEGKNIEVTANGTSFWLSQDEAKNFTRQSSILRGAWQNSQGEIMYDKCFTTLNGVAYIQNGYVNHSIKLSDAEVNLFVESVKNLSPIEITPAANWVTN